MRRKAVITGMGILAPGGTTVDSWWIANCSGASFINWVTLCEPEHIPFPYAGEILNFDPVPYFGKKARANRHSRTTQIAVAAATQAIAQSNWRNQPLLTKRPIFMLLGISLGGTDVTEKGIRRLAGGKPIPATGVSAIHLTSLSVIEKLIPAPCRMGALSNSCVGGIDAIAQSAQAIERGEADVALTGGADASITPYIFGGLEAVNSLSHHPGPPEAASRPFDIAAQGGVLGEASAIFILEDLNHALARGATPLAEICGYGNTIDEGTNGSGLESSMQIALNDSMLMPRDIDFINAHAPGDSIIDEQEMRSIKNLFGNYASHIPVTSVKGMTGNPMGAGGAVQAISSVCTLRDQIIPPTANCKNPLPHFNLNIITGNPLKLGIEHIMINSHGMLGVNSTLILRKYGDSR